MNENLTGTTILDEIDPCTPQNIRTAYYTQDTKHLKLNCSNSDEM